MENTTLLEMDAIEAKRIVRSKNKELINVLKSILDASNNGISYYCVSIKLENMTINALIDKKFSVETHSESTIKENGIYHTIKW